MSEQIDEFTFTRHFARMWGSDFGFRESFLLVMSPVAALLVQKLSGCPAIGKPGSPRWIPASTQFLYASLRLTAKQQNKALKELLTAGFIEIKKRGAPPTRLVKIDYYAIHLAIDAAEDGEAS